MKKIRVQFLPTAVLSGVLVVIADCVCWNEKR